MQTKDERIAGLQAEVDRLTAILNTPLFEEFAEAVVAEAAHQESRQDQYKDELKEPEDWYWLIKYLAGKALQAHADRDRKKALHHTISSAAALAHWHAAILAEFPKPAGQAKTRTGEQDGTG